ncbi:MAG: diacylglycerol kinase family protein [Pyrinomonadaceae bacterium]
MPVAPKTLLVVNPKAARAARIFPQVRETLSATGISFDVHETRAAGDATAATRDALRRGFHTIVAVGGDGTISETAAGFFDLTTGSPQLVFGDGVLGIVPAGTGNDFARGLTAGAGAAGNLSTENWVELIIHHLQMREQVRSDPVDLIYGTTDDGASRFIVLNVASLGLGPEAARSVTLQPAWLHSVPGSIRFVLAACAALAHWRERFVLVTIDDRPPLKCQTNLAAIANNRFAGGGMMLAPAARIDDGKMDLMLACGLTRWGIARELLRIRKGGHLQNPCVSTFVAERVRIEAITSDDALLVEADGNLRGHTAAEFCIVPKSLRLIRP